MARGRRAGFREPRPAHLGALPARSGAAGSRPLQVVHQRDDLELRTHVECAQDCGNFLSYLDGLKPEKRGHRPSTMPAHQQLQNKSLPTIQGGNLLLQIMSQQSLLVEDALRTREVNQPRIRRAAPRFNAFQDASFRILAANRMRVFATEYFESTPTRHRRPPPPRRVAAHPASTPAALPPPPPRKALAGATEHRQRSDILKPPRATRFGPIGGIVAPA